MSERLSAEAKRQFRLMAERCRYGPHGHRCKSCSVVLRVLDAYETLEADATHTVPHWHGAWHVDPPEYTALTTLTVSTPAEREP